MFPHDSLLFATITHERVDFLELAFSASVSSRLVPRVASLHSILVVRHFTSFLTRLSSSITLLRAGGFPIFRERIETTSKATLIGSDTCNVRRVLTVAKNNQRQQ